MQWLLREVVNPSESHQNISENLCFPTYNGEKKKFFMRFSLPSIDKFYGKDRRGKKKNLPCIISPAPLLCFLKNEYIDL